VWERVTDQDSFAGSRMAAVAAGSDRYVAVGTNDATDEAPTGVAWFSTDGRAWQRSSATLDGIPDGIIWDGQRYVAFGGGGGEVPAAVWTSPDGESWQRATDATGWDEVVVMFIANLNGELFAIGGGWGDSEFPRPDTFDTWSSSDGITWQPVSALTPPPQMVGLTGMTAGNGMLLAFGPSAVEPAFRPIAVRSTDGGAWESANLGKADSRPWDVVGGDSFVAVGSGPYCCEAGAEAPVRAWTSGDGSTWTAAAFEPQAGNDELEHVVWYGGRYVSLGTYVGMPISWLSDDGKVWTESDSVPDAAVDGDPCTGGPCPVTTVSDLAGGAAGLVAVGEKEIFDEDTGDHLSWRSVVWIAPAVED
jgi:hypothetical protein